MPDASEQAGEVRLFTRSMTGDWSYAATLTAPSPVAGEKFGYRVAMDGATLAVCALNGGGGMGKVYVFTGGDASWTYEASFTPAGLIGGSVAGSPAFGSALAVSGNRIAAGAPNHNPSASGGPSGAAFVYARSGNTWSLQLEDPGLGSASAYFGRSVALQGDYLAVGDQGHVFGFWYGVSNGAGFSPSPSWYRLSQAIPASASSGFGTQCAISYTGLIAGDWRSTATNGSLTAFYPQGANMSSYPLINWVRRSPYSQQIPSIDLAEYGSSLAFSNDVAIVGATGFQGSPGSMPGGIFFNAFDSSGLKELQHFNASNTSSGLFFGSSVAISDRTAAAAGSTDGVIHFFHAQGPGPRVTTLAASDVLRTSATLHGIVNHDCADTQIAFDYGTSPDLGNTTSPISRSATSTDSAVDLPLGGLISHQRYYYRLRAWNQFGMNTGSVQTFFTGNDDPVIGGSFFYSFDEGSIGTVTGTVSDPDGDALTLSASEGTVTQSGGTWTWTRVMPDGPVSNNLVTITASDGMSSVPFFFLYESRNVVPVLTVAGADVTVAQYDTASMNGTWIDPGASVSTDTEPVLSANIGTVTRGSNGTWAWTHSTSTPGDVPVTITANDGNSTATTSFVLHVRDVSAPGFGAGQNSLIAVIPGMSCEGPMPDLTSRLTVLDNVGVVLILQSITPGTIVQAGTYDVTFTAFDAAGNSSSDTISVTLGTGSSTLHDALVDIPNGNIQQIGTSFIGNAGYSVAVSGNYAAMSIPGTVRVLIYRWDETTQDWALEDTIGTPSTNPNAASSFFGSSIALSGTSLIVGAQVTREAFVFTRDASGHWTKQQQLTAPFYVGPGTPTNFGSKVAIDGDTAVVSTADGFAVGTTRYGGGAWVYKRTGATWSGPVELYSDDLAYTGNVGPGGYGYTVSISGQRIAVSRSADGAKVYVFGWNGSAFVQEQTIATGGGTYCCVALDGDRLLIGDPNFEKVHRYSRASGTWTADGSIGPGGPVPHPSYFGASVALSGDRALVGAWMPYPIGTQVGGFVTPYRFDGSTWTASPYVTLGNAAGAGAFGRSLALSGHRGIAGAPLANQGGKAKFIHIPPAPGPLATTLAATLQPPSSALLNAIIGPRCLATTVSFEWGTTTAYGNTTPARIVGTATAGPPAEPARDTGLPFNETITGLQPGTTYHCRVKATNIDGTAYGQDVTFATRRAPLFAAVPANISVWTMSTSGPSRHLHRAHRHRRRRQRAHRQQRTRQRHHLPRRHHHRHLHRHRQHRPQQHRHLHRASEAKPQPHLRRPQRQHQQRHQRAYQFRPTHPRAQRPRRRPSRSRHTRHHIERRQGSI